MGSPDLWNCLFTNAYLQAFLTNVLGLLAEQSQRFPGICWAM